MRNTHLCYILLLTALGAVGWYRSEQQSRLEQSVYNPELGVQALEAENRTLLYEIQRSARFYFYQNPRTNQHATKAFQAESLVRACLEKISSLEPSEYLLLVDTLKTRLCELAEDDPTVIRQLNELLPSDPDHVLCPVNLLQKVLVTWLNSLQKTDNDQYRQTALYQYDALARDLSIPDLDPALRDPIQNGTRNTAQATLLGLTASALCTSLSGQTLQFAQQLSAYKTLDAVMPNLAPDQPAIAGQPFKADIFPVYYTTRRDSTSTPFVNGTAGTFKQGQFHFWETAEKRGQKQYLVRVEDRRLSGDTIEYQKKMEIRVW